MQISKVLPSVEGPTLKVVNIKFRISENESKKLYTHGLQNTKKRAYRNWDSYQIVEKNGKDLRRLIQ